MRAKLEQSVKLHVLRSELRNSSMALSNKLASTQTILTLLLERTLSMNEAAVARFLLERRRVIASSRT